MDKISDLNYGNVYKLTLNFGQKLDKVIKISEYNYIILI